MDSLLAWTVKKQSYACMHLMKVDIHLIYAKDLANILNMKF